jgi:hypothetical protein
MQKGTCQITVIGSDENGKCLCVSVKLNDVIILSVCLTVHQHKRSLGPTLDVDAV